MNQHLLIILLKETRGISLVKQVIIPQPKNKQTEIVTGCFHIFESKEFSINALKMNRTMVAIIRGSDGMLIANPISCSFNSNDNGVTNTININSLSIDSKLNITNAMATGKR